MFLGHFGLAFAAKKAAPQLPLPVLFASSQFADILWPVLVGAGVERVRIEPGITRVTPLDFVSYPWSHSLLMLAVWGVVLGGGHALARRRQPGAAVAGVVIGSLVVSHWVLDWFMHRPDMPLVPGGATYGLGLWGSIPGTLVAEFALLGVGVWAYLGATRATSARGRWVFVGLLALLVVGYLSSYAGPPPSVRALWVTALAGFGVIIGWAWWAERHRVSAV